MGTDLGVCRRANDKFNLRKCVVRGNVLMNVLEHDNELNYMGMDLFQREQLSTLKNAPLHGFTFHFLIR